MKRLLTPAVVLLFLSPAVGELLSTSSPPAEFFNPIALLLLASFYGSGALIVHELVHRWGKGWPSVLLLGAAYGIVEEGVACKSFFDPAWMDLGPLGVYGRWLGVNWVWAVGLTIYHAVFSIGVPILLVGLMFPAQRDQPWLTRRGLRWMAGLFIVMTLFMYIALTPYRPPVLALLLAAGAIVGLAAWARRAAAPAPTESGKVLPSPRRIAVAAFAATLGFFFLLWFLPNTPVPAAAWIVLTGGLVVWIRRALGSWAAHPGWQPRHALALATGGLSFLLLLSPLAEMDTTRPDNTSGSTLVALVGAGLLIWATRRLRHQAWTIVPS